MRSCVLIAILATGWQPAIAEAQSGDASPPAISSPYLVLIRDPTVHELLDLDDKQQAAIGRLTDQVDGPLWRTRAMPAQQSAIEVARLITEAKRRIGGILTPAQQTRLSQIELRAIGMPSLFLTTVRKDLELKNSQLKQIATTLDDSKQAQADARKKHRTDAKRLGEKLSKLYADEKKKIADILNLAQQRRLRELLGEPFDNSKLGKVRFKAPELEGADGWINTRGLRMADLRGRVTVLHFWTYG